MPLIHNSIEIVSQDLTALFSALSNEVRQRCLRLVATNGEMCVCEFVDAMEISQSSASKALCALKAIGVLEDRRDRNWTYYSQARDLSPEFRKIIDATLTHLADSFACEQDQKRFRRVSNSRSQTEVCS